MNNPDWLSGLTHKDWLLDGRPIRGEHMLAIFNGLQWPKAVMDLGPSPAGNPGPYWHVPDADDDCSHRLYPKLPKKWRGLVRHVCEASAKR